MRIVIIEINMGTSGGTSGPNTGNLGWGSGLPTRPV